MPHDIEPRLLRAFAVVAEELHFSRAAARLYVAQQALSRDVRRLERELGTELFVRTTRRVELTAEGERLLPYAKAVLRAQDDLAAACGAGRRPLLVDVSAPVGTGGLVLAEARRAAPDTEFVARFHSGLTRAVADVLAGRLDVSFGRVAGLAPALLAGLCQRPVRHERMAVLLPDDHPLSGLARVPLDALAGESLYAGAGNPATAEWTDLAVRLFAGRGIEVAAPFPEIAGEAEFVRLVQKRRWPVLATTQFLDVPGTALRPLVDPVPLSTVSMVWRRGLRHPGLDALQDAASRLAAEHGWLARPAGSWLAEPDARLAAAADTGRG